MPWALASDNWHAMPDVRTAHLAKAAVGGAQGMARLDQRLAHEPWHHTPHGHRCRRFAFGSRLLRGLAFGGFPFRCRVLCCFAFGGFAFGLFPC